MIDPTSKLSIEQQCKLMNVNRSTHYYKPREKNELNLRLKIGKLFQETPVYGYRRITACLRRGGLLINHKKVQRIMQDVGLKAICPGPVTTRYKKGDKIYPNLLKGVEITRPYQAYQTDITYIRTIYGFMYLVALIDSYSRYIVSWRLSNSLSAESCIEALCDALAFYPHPDTMHSDRGCQFTSYAWVNMLKEHNINISMSGQGNSNGNGKVERLWRTLKYEYLYVIGFKDAVDLKNTIARFVLWYNTQRPHQALGYRTPEEILENPTQLGTKFMFTKKEEEDIKNP